MLRVCNISCIIILKYVNRDLCIAGQKTLFLQDESSEFWHRLHHSPLCVLREVISSGSLCLHCKMDTFLPYKVASGSHRSCMLQAKNCNTLIINHYDFYPHSQKIWLTPATQKSELLGLSTNKLKHILSLQYEVSVVQSSQRAN